MLFIVSCILLILWCVLVMVRVARLVMVQVSHFELQRQAKEGVIDAVDELDYVAALPRIETLRAVTTTLLEVIITIIAVGYFGWQLGAVVAIVLLLIAPLGRRSNILGSFADKMALKYRVQLLTAADRAALILNWMRSRDIGGQEARIFSREELIEVVERSPDVLSHEEVTRIRAGLAFRGKIVSDIMTPRTMIESIPASEVLGPLVLDELYKTGHSRFPVIDGDVDHVIGVLLLRDLMDQAHADKHVAEAMNSKVFYVHQDKTLEHALHAFLTTHHHMFIVVNEYRETVGLLTLEDVLEALLGHKIIDEFDTFDDLRAVAESNPRKNNQPKGKHDL